MRYIPASALKAASTAIAAMALATCGLVATPFPKFGSTPFRVEGVYSPAAGQTAVPMTIYRAGAQLRVETVLPKLGPSTIVYERATGAAYALAPISAYSVMAATSAPSTSTGAPPSAPTPSVAPLAPDAGGIAIRISNGDAPQPFETYWASLGPNSSDAVGGCHIAGERGHQWRERMSTKGVEPRTACITNDGIVLQIRQGDTAIFEATRVQRGRISASLFAIPPNYQRFDPQAVAASEPPATPVSITSLTPAG